MKARGLGRVYQRGRVWWVQYCFRGKVYRESSASIKRVDAVKLLRRRLEEMGRGRLIGPDVERTSFECLAQAFLDDYRINHRRSFDRAERSVAHLRKAFNLVQALDITTDQISRYVVARRAGPVPSLQTALAARLTIATGSRDGNEAPVQDRLLTAEEVAALIGTSPRWLYRHHKHLPFARQLSRKVLRFSEAELRKWMNARKRT